MWEHVSWTHILKSSTIGRTTNNKIYSKAFECNLSDSICLTTCSAAIIWVLSHSYWKWHTKILKQQMLWSKISLRQLYFVLFVQCLKHSCACEFKRCQKLIDFIILFEKARKMWSKELFLSDLSMRPWDSKRI